jgi:diguanylate cyclase (GGDEF)-like protein
LTIAPQFVFQINTDGILLEFYGNKDNNIIISSDQILGKHIQDVMPLLSQQIMLCTEQAFGATDPLSFENNFVITIDDRCYKVVNIVCAANRLLVMVYDVADTGTWSLQKSHRYHDSLTNLPNRYLFQDRLNHVIALAQRKNRFLAVLHIDLDNFRRINELFGPDAGDEVLCDVAGRLSASLRKTDAITRLQSDESDSILARVGGDEFTILLTEITNVLDAAMVCRRILDILSMPFIVDNKEVFLTASIGISVYPYDGKDMATLTKNADIAMNQAKKAGKNNCEYYTEAMNTSSLERFTIENKLRTALEKNELMLFYQPQVDLMTGKILGAEALVRWLQPDLVFIKPGNFIPVAEETGLIIPMGEWILHSACKQGKAWQEEGLELFDLSVNISGIQFMQEDFVGMVTNSLRESGFDPSYLKLELTESIVMKDPQNAVKKMNSLKQLGIQISIDDFGTGYSSMSYLKRFPTSSLKVDRSFIQDIDTNPDDQTIVRAIIALAHNLNIKVIAEGVETKKQLWLLRGYGCDGAQGFYFCPPVNPTAFVEFMVRKKITVSNEKHQEAVR